MGSTTRGYLYEPNFYGSSLAFSRIYFTHRICGMSIKKYFADVITRGFLVSLITTFLALLPLLFMPEGLTRLILVLIISSVSAIILIVSVGLNPTEKTLVLAMGKNVLQKIK